MSKSLTGALVAALAFGGLATVTTQAGAMPMLDRTPATMAEAAAPGDVQAVAWRCGPYRCYRHRYPDRPFYPAYGRWHRPVYGWHRPAYGWHRWHRPYGY